MAACVSIMDALLLLAALSTGARADIVTWSSCKEEGDARGRVREGSSPDKNATHLDLTNCTHSIETLQIDAFNGLINLESISLEGNRIEYINPVVFAPVRNITRLDLRSNYLRELPDFGEHSLFPRLHSLDLNYNNITVLNNPNVLSECTQLKKLELSHNNIQHIHPDFFKPLTRLMYLWLNNNKIKIIPDNMFSIKCLRYLQLDHNIIEYVSAYAFSGSSLTDLFLDNNRLTQLPVNFVSELNKGVARLFNLSFEQNPWDCACLLELLADAKRVGMEYYTFDESTEEYFDTRAVCVFAGLLCLHRAPSWLPSQPSPHQGAPRGNLTDVGFGNKRDLYRLECFR